jgi:hypothetical protein
LIRTARAAIDWAMTAIPYLLCDALLVIALILVPGIALYLPGFL